MVNVYEVLDEVLRRPYLFLREQSVEHLDTFVRGMLHCRPDHLVDFGDPDFRDFGHWLAAKEGFGLDGRGWERRFEGDLDAFHSALDAFRADTLQVVATAAVKDNIRWPHAGTWTINGVETTGAESPPVHQVELRSYRACEAFFLRALYTDGSLYRRWCWTRDRATAVAEKELGIKEDDWRLLTA